MVNRTGIRWNRYSWWLALCVGALGILSALVAGCGGNDGGTTVEPPAPPPVVPFTTTFRATILWGARTRLEGLSSALSARITLKGSNVGGGDNSFVINRDPAKLPAYQQVYTSPVAALPGVYQFTVRFFAKPDATGSEVGFADASATLTKQGDLTTTIATYGGVRGVTVVPNQHIKLGETKDITFTALDASGNVLALDSAGGSLTLGSGAVSVVTALPATLRLESNGQVTAIRPYFGQVQVRIDALTSVATNVFVDSDVALSVAPASVNPLGWENQVQLTPTLTGLPAGLSGSDLGVTYAIESDNGKLGTISASGLYTAPKSDVSPVILVTGNYDQNPSKIVRVPITVTSLTVASVNVAGVAVSLAPDTNRVSVKQVVDFDAIVKNGSLTPTDQKVTWTLEGPNGEANTGNLYGTITTAGVYAAPATRPGTTGDCRVRVVPNYDPTKPTLVPIRVVEGNVGVIVN